MAQKPHCGWEKRRSMTWSDSLFSLPNTFQRFWQLPWPSRELPAFITWKTFDDNVRICVELLTWWWYVIPYEPWRIHVFVYYFKNCLSDSLLLLCCFHCRYETIICVCFLKNKLKMLGRARNRTDVAVVEEEVAAIMTWQQWVGPLVCGYVLLGRCEQRRNHNQEIH
jgi:hypothetical protein